MSRSRGSAAAGPLLFDVGPPPAPRDAAYALVALNRPVEREFSYAVPAALLERVRPGVRVAVPFGREREVGVVVALSTSCEHDASRVKPLAKVLDDEPLVDESLLELTRWIAQRYACSWGEALHAVLPAALKREAGSAKVLFVRAAEGVGTAELAQLEEKHAVQHRVLRTLLELGGRIELRELCRRLNATDSAARTLARRGWVVIEKCAARVDEFELARADRPRPASLHPQQTAALARLIPTLVRR